MGAAGKATYRGRTARPDLMYQLEQEHMLAQIISSMPNNQEGHPDITVPAPIRAKWAHRLFQQGVRVHTEMATHAVIPMNSGATGQHGPMTFQKVDKDKMMAMIQKANPNLYQKIMRVRNDENHGGPAAEERLLQEILAKMPQEWIEKVTKGDQLADTLLAQAEPAPEPQEYTN